MNQILNSYHVVSIENQRVIALAPFLVEKAYKKYTKCAMNVYLPILEDQSQNESETAVYGCHWPRDRYTYCAHGPLSSVGRAPVC